MQPQITKRQKELLGLVYQYIKDTGYPPTLQEMRQALGVASNQSALDLLAKLEKQGVVKRKEGIARSVVILPLGYKILGKPGLAAFLGATSAGSPIEAVEISGQWQVLPSNDEKLEKLDSDVFILKIYGDSMINAGIDDGDLVLVQSKKEFSSGEVVLANIGSESTVKRFISQDKPPYTFLKPENPKYQNIAFSEDTSLVGKVIAVLKNGFWKSLK